MALTKYTVCFQSDSEKYTAQSVLEHFIGVFIRHFAHLLAIIIMHYKFPQNPVATNTHFFAYGLVVSLWLCWVLL